MLQQSFNQTTNVEPRITVRFSTASDVPAVLNFYQSNLHPDVDYRGDDIFTDRTKSGRTILILKPDATIGLASISHPHYKADVVEIGSTIGGINGVSLYPFVIASQIIYEFLERTPKETFLAMIHKTNHKVTNMLNNKVGWHMMTPTQDFANAVGEGENIPTLDWLRADSDTLAHQARIVSDVVQKGTLPNLKTGEDVKLDLSRFPLATTFASHVDALAHGRFGEMLEGSDHLPLVKARAALEKYLKGVTYFPEMSAKI